MIAIIGCEEGPEVDAARQIKQAILKAWPWIDTDSNSTIYLVPNVQCHGENPRDIDLVVLASLPTDRATFNPTVQLHFSNGNFSDADIVRVGSLCVVVEVKDHVPKDIRFTGTKVEVRYHSENNNNQWHSASQQSEKQKYSLRNYMARNFPDIPIPWITNLIWLRNVSRDDLPKVTHNILPATLTWTTFLNAVVSNTNIIQDNNEIFLGGITTNSKFSFSKVCEMLTRPVTPTNLDRKRMDRIANAEIKDIWIDNLGKKQIIFEGRGGTGKTIILLGLAWSLKNIHNNRVLFLTYNMALVADLRRLLTLMGLSDEIGQPYIEIQTVHSFIYQLLSCLKLIELHENDFLGHYDELKKELLALLQSGALNKNDIQELITKSPEQFSWDYIFIDEAQDWFKDERDILRQLFYPSQFVIADGRDQLVRSSVNCDWSEGLDKLSTQKYPLQRGLRMKANLARFTNTLAQEMGLTSWSIQENVEALGGKIIIVEGDYSNAQKFHNGLIEDALSVGNSPVDLLTCIPPNLVDQSSGIRHAITADLFSLWNYQVWDGVSGDIRRSYPTSSEQLRIIQYDSCRGLEGWTVINLEIDNFYNYKISTWNRSIDQKTSAVEEEILAQRFAARWLMIPCSRAIDMLVLNLRDANSFLGQHIKVVAKRYPDFIEWIKL